MCRRIWPLEIQPWSEASRFKTKAPGLERQLEEAHLERWAHPPHIPRDWEAHKINRAALLTLQNHKRGLCSLPGWRRTMGERQAGSKGKDASLKSTLGRQLPCKPNRWTCGWWPSKKTLPSAKGLSYWKKVQLDRARSGWQRVVVWCRLPTSHARGPTQDESFKYITQMWLCHLQSQMLETPIVANFPLCFPESPTGTKMSICDCFLQKRVLCYCYSSWKWNRCVPSDLPRIPLWPSPAESRLPCPRSHDPIPLLLSPNQYHHQLPRTPNEEGFIGSFPSYEDTPWSLWYAANHPSGVPVIVIERLQTGRHYR